MKRTLILALTFLFCLSVPCYAAQPDESNAAQLEQFEDYISDLMDSEDVVYTFYDYEGNDISEEFYAKAKEISSIEELYREYTADVAVSVKREETITPYRSDLSKTATETVSQNCTPVSGDIDMVKYDEKFDSINGYIYYKLIASLTYNPNTYEITSTTPIRRTGLDWGNKWAGEMLPYVLNEVSYTPTVKGYTATFRHSLSIHADYAPGGVILGTINYGSISRTLTITVG